MRRIGTQLAGLGVAAVAPTLAAFILLPIFSYYLTPAEFGVFALLQAAGVVFSVMGSFGVLCVAPFYYTEERDPVARRRKIGNLIICATAINAAILALLLTAGRPLFCLLFPSVSSGLIGVTLAQSALSPYIDTPTVAWKMSERSNWVAGMTLLRVGLVSIVQLLLIVGMGHGLVGLVWGGFWGTLAASVIFMVAIRKELSWWLSISELKKALVFGLPSIPNATFTNVYRFADRVILERFVSHDVIGLYYLALRFGDLLKVGIDVFTQAWTPVFYKEALDPARRPALAGIAAILTVVFGGGAIVSAVMGEYYIIGTMNASFHDAIYLVPFAVVAQLFKGLYTYPHLSIWLSKKSYWFPFITVGPMIVSVVANLLVIPTWGTYGAGGVMMAGFALHAGLTYFVGQKVMFIPYRYGRMGSVVMVASLLIFLLSPLVSNWPVALRAFLGVGLYGVVAVVAVIPVARKQENERRSVTT